MPETDNHHNSSSSLRLERVQTVPDPYEPFYISQAIKYGGLLYISGQAAIGDDGELVGRNNFAAQGEQAIKNLRRVLLAGGSDLNKIIKVTIFVTDMKSQFSTIRELRKKYFSVPYPADSIVEVKGLYDPDAMIEIEAIAAIS